MTHMDVYPCRVNNTDFLVLSNIMSYKICLLQNCGGKFEKVDDHIHFHHSNMDMAMGHINIHSIRTSYFHPY